MQTIAERVKKAREKMGISQTELAERAGMALSWLNKIESGAASPGKGAVSQLARELLVSVTYLQTGDVEDRPGDLTAEIVTNEELGYLHRFRKLPRKERPTILYLMEALIHKPAVTEGEEDEGHDESSGSGARQAPGNDVKRGATGDTQNR